MLTKLETILAIAIACLTLDNILLASYIAHPNLMLMYAGFVCETLFFIIISIGFVHFVRVKKTRVIAGE